MSSDPPIYDIFIVGGGINGCGIARDAAGRGMKVALAEMHDLASATSSASTKLLHGGLRYLEYFDFRLVRESLKERDILLKNMPHIAWPLRFILPIHNEMRFEETTPASKLLTSIIPWMRGRRPPWLIQLGLILYDGFAGQTILPKMAVVDLTQDQAGEPIKEHFKKAFEYSDCWVDDSRLVALNARAAGNLGAQIMTRTKVVKCYVQDGIWQIELDAQGIKQTIQSKILINAAGPWVDEFLSQTIRNNNRKHIRLVRGSHIVTRKLYDHEKCYIFQGSDSRIIFIIPYEKNYSLIGTTDSDHSDINKLPQCTEEEKNYLLSVASEYLKTSLSEKDILWTYSGIRPLIEDGSSSATKTTRDYKLEVNTDGGA
ncbi:MAG: glycerol-3-phosphate dehydrogenase, partial [Rhodobacteraceae bacterium]|nr:glycerol-3-phosphate dehydrogenase [Paracoccaceae bacterium]